MYIYGKNVALDYINKEEKIKKAYISKSFKEQDIINYLKKNNILIKEKEKYELDKLVDGMHQGIILEVNDYEYSDIDEFLDSEFIVILDHIEDPHNLGAIIRTCEAANVGGIIIPKDRAAEVNSTVIKVSTGAIENMKIAQVTNINSTMEYLKKNGYWIVGTDIAGTNYYEIDYKGKIAIVIGNEGKGMNKLTHDNCDFIATIPMKGTTNSLNASVATGIVLFEAVKQRGE